MATQLPALNLWISSEFEDLLKRESAALQLKNSELVRAAAERQLRSPKRLVPAVVLMTGERTGGSFRVHLPEQLKSAVEASAEAEGIRPGLWVEAAVIAHLLAVYRERREQHEAIARSYTARAGELGQFARIIPGGFAALVAP